MAVELGKHSEDTRLSLPFNISRKAAPYAEQELIAIAEGMKSLEARLLLVELKLELGKICRSQATYGSDHQKQRSRFLRHLSSRSHCPGRAKARRRAIILRGPHQT